MPEPWKLGVLAAAAWRTWMLLAWDSILDAPRDRLFPGGSPSARWLVCPYCAGFWVVLAWTVAWAIDDRTVWAALPFALNAAVILFDRIIDVLEKHGE